MPFILLILLPFVQIGVTYYLSVQTIAAMVLFIFTFRYIATNSLLMWICVLLIAAAMMISVFSISGSNTEDIFRRGREVLFFSLICLSARGYSGKAPFNITPRSHLPIVAIAIGLALLALAQYVVLGGGAYLGLPKDLYIANKDTLPDLLDLKYGKLRPFGTFGEPSYFSFVLLSLFVMLSPLVRARFSASDKRDERTNAFSDFLRPASSVAILGCVAITIAGMLSQSLSFYLAFPILLYVCVVKFSSPRIQFRFAVCVGSVVAVLLVSSFASVVLGRVSMGASDTSTSARLTKPLQIIPQYLVEHPFGAPLSKWMEAISPISSQYGVPASAVGHNALFNSFFNYGIIGLACLILTIGSPKSLPMRLYVTFSFLFNGSIFSVDKYFTIALTLAIYAGYEHFIASGRSSSSIFGQNTQPSRSQFSGASI